MNYSITINFTNCHFVAYSFIELINYIFTIPDVKSVLSEHISQVPLENTLRDVKEEVSTKNQQVMSL